MLTICIDSTWIMVKQSGKVDCSSWKSHCIELYTKFCIVKACSKNHILSFKYPNDTFLDILERGNNSLQLWCWSLGLIHLVSCPKGWGKMADLVSFLLFGNFTKCWKWNVLMNTTSMHHNFQMVDFFWTWIYTRQL